MPRRRRARTHTAYRVARRMTLAHMTRRGRADPDAARARVRARDAAARRPPRRGAGDDHSVRKLHSIT
eukprot:COSAG02_NODE_3110_length_7343_cov_14.255936_2_plen_68_part_00